MNHRHAGTGALLLLAALGARAGAAAEDGPRYVYRAGQGDTIYGIAQQYLAQPGRYVALQRLNGVKNPRRLPVGSAIAIPVAWMRSDPGAASVVRVQGEARAAAEPLAPGARVPEGGEVRTGGDGYVTLRLPDGSLLDVQTGSTMALERLRVYPGTPMQDAAMSLRAGQVDAHASPQKGPASRFEIRTPSAAAGVRGTDFRVGVVAASGATRNEVLSGAVAVTPGAANAAAVSVAAGQAVLVAPDQAVAVPVPLLAAPDLARVPALQDRVSFRIPLGAVPGASAYRARLSTDSGFERIAAETVSRSAEPAFSGLPDADYWLAVRAIDAQGLEGIDAVGRFRLKARPEPPFLRNPQDRAIMRGGPVAFEWTQGADADHFHFQLARDAAFADMVTDDARAGAGGRAFDDLPPAEYFWRVASVRANDDQGPYSQVQRLSRRAPPAVPELKSDDATVTVAWAGEPGQTFAFEMARDEAFASMAARATLTEPRITLQKPGPGTYFVRTRATDADGFVGPYSTVQRFTVPVPPPPPPPWWLLLLPLLPLAL